MLAGMSATLVAGWMDQIWREIWSVMVNDAYFRVFEHAREITGRFKKDIAVLVHNGYLTFQMAGIRRLCDRRPDVISLTRALTQTKVDIPKEADRIDLILQILEARSRHVITQTNQYIAHTADPDRTRKPAAWNMQLKHLTEAQEAICKCATAFDRDVLQRQTYTNVIPVNVGDIMEDFRHWVPETQMPELYKFWHAHVRKVDDWGRHPYAWSEEAP